jgi:hypothetical protein
MPIALIPLPYVSLSDAAVSLYLSRSATYAMLRRLGLPYHVETRRVGGNQANRGHYTRSVFLSRETMEALSVHRWRRLKPRGGSRRPARGGS